MVCSVCGGSGHNKRTCVAKKFQKALDYSGMGDDLKEQITDFLTEEITDEALSQAIEMGADNTCPGLDTTIKLGRYGWRAFKAMR